MSCLAAFRDRLLDLIPIYSEAGRALARLPTASPEPTARDLAAACGRWLLGAVQVDGKPLRDLATALAEVRSPEALVLLARETAARADDSLAQTARHAEAAGRAAAAGRDDEAGRAAADCLYSRRSAGIDYIVAEARALTTGAADSADP